MNDFKECVIFASADWDAPYWTNNQHTAAFLAKSGYQILYVETVGLRTPNLASGRDLSRIWRRLKRGLRGPRLVQNGIWVLSPLLFPFKHHIPLVQAFNQGLLRFVLKRFLNKEFSSKPMIWTYHPYMLNVLPKASLGPLVYHCVDDTATVPGIDGEAFNKEERLLLDQADTIFTTSPFLRDKCTEHNPNVFDFPNVVDVEHFSRALQMGPLPLELQAIPQPRIGYIGKLSDFKIDFALILEIARMRPEWQWILIGDEREGQSNPYIAQLRELPNVHFLGYRPYDTLPDYMRGLDVGVLPTLLNEYTRSMFPMKYFEYLAAGVPVAVTPLNFTQYHSAGLEVGADVQGFTDAIACQLQRGKFTIDEALEFVGNNTWAERMKKMLLLVENRK
jgi:glycosyltransferase involved in cell wall biosynthesis